MSRPLVLSRERPGHAGLTDEEHAVYDEHIRELHALLEQYGDFYKIPRDIEREMADRHRLDWVRWVERRDRGAFSTGMNPGLHSARDKTKRLMQFVADHKGETLTVRDMAEAVECALGTAYAFIRDHPAHVRARGYGSVYVVDPEAERARDAATAATLAAGGPIDTDRVNDAASALAAFTGHAASAVAPPAWAPRRGAPGKD